MYCIEVNPHCFRLCQSYTDPLTGKKRTVSVTRSDKKRKTQEEARAVLESRIAAITSRTAAPRDLTLGQLSARYLSERDDIRPQTLLASEYHLRRVLRILGEDTRADALTAFYISQKIAEKDKEISTRNGHIKAIKALLRWAHDAGYVSDVSYLSSVRKYRDEKGIEKRKIKYLEKEEIEKLVEGLAVEKWRSLTLFLILSGLRVGEALALTPRDVDEKNRTITVDKTYSLPLRKVSPFPKTDSSIRLVHMQQELLALCADIRKRTKPRRLFFEDHGEPYSYDAYAKYFRENCERILGRRLTPHALRHTHASLLAAAGVPLETISRRLGHTDSQITREIYLHVTEELRQRDNSQIDGLGPVFG